jgi:hypothetical protein
MRIKSSLHSHVTDKSPYFQAFFIAIYTLILFSGHFYKYLLLINDVISSQLAWFGKYSESNTCSPESLTKVLQNLKIWHSSQFLRIQWSGELTLQFLLLLKKEMLDRPFWVQKTPHSTYVVWAVASNNLLVIQKEVSFEQPPGKKAVQQVWVIEPAAL